MPSQLDNFSCNESVSQVAKQHKIMKIGVQPKGLLTLQSLLTCNQKSSSRHAQRTPLSSHQAASTSTDVVEILGSRTPLPYSQQQLPNHPRALGSAADPSETVPPWSRIYAAKPGRREEPSPSKTLFFGHSLAQSEIPKIWSPKPTPTVLSPVDMRAPSFAQPRGLHFRVNKGQERVAMPASSRKLSIQEWTVATDQDQELCSSAFLSLCFLLSMADPSQVL
jgi:hypothetical protein